MILTLALVIYLLSAITVAYMMATSPTKWTPNDVGYAIFVILCPLVNTVVAYVVAKAEKWF